MAKPEVSIICTCYNLGRYLAEALESIKVQDYTNWECIILDDGSTDETKKIANEYVLQDSRFRYIYQNNQGVVVARNNAIKAAIGKYIISVDSDDRITKDCLDLCVRRMKESNSKLVYFDAEYFGDKEGLVSLPDYSFRKLLAGNCIPVFGMFKREDFLKTQGYNLNMKNGYEDWDFWITLLQDRGKVEKINRVLYFYRKKKGSRNIEVKKKERELFANIVRNHPYIYYEQYCSLLNDYNNIVNSKAFPIFIFFNKIIKALKYLLRKV